MKVRELNKLLPEWLTPGHQDQRRVILSVASPHHQFLTSIALCPPTQIMKIRQRND